MINRKRKWTVRAGLGLLPIVSLVLVSLIRTEVERSITVSAAVFDVSAQLTDLRNYNAWYPGVGNETGNPVSPSSLEFGNGKKLDLAVINPTVIRLIEKDGTKETVQSIAAVPLADQKQTDIIWVKDLPLYQRVANFFTGRDLMQDGLVNLKARLEDPARRYGFEITLVPVSDSIILTARATAPDSARTNTLQSLYNRVSGYVKRGQPKGAKDYYYVTSGPVAGNLTEFALGIPVEQPTIPEAGIEYLRLPVTGHVLTGKATAGQLSDLYTAMNRFANDQGLQKVAQQLEKFTVEPALVQQHPESAVELVFPVF